MVNNANSIFEVCCTLSFPGRSYRFDRIRNDSGIRRPVPDPGTVPLPERAYVGQDLDGAEKRARPAIPDVVRNGQGKTV